MSGSKRARAWFVRGAITTVALLGVAAVGCGGSDDDGGSGTTSAGGGGATDAVFRVGGMDRVTTINTFRDTATDQDYMNVRMTHPTLVEWSEEEGRLVGDLADSWESSADGSVWTFHIRPGARWSDGEPLDAEDAAWTINQRIKAEIFPNSTRGIVSATAPDPETLVVRYDSPRGDVLERFLYLGILPEQTWAAVFAKGADGARAYGPENEAEMVSAGPYALKDFKPNEFALFRADPGFYNPDGKAQNGGVLYRVFGAADAMAAALRSGELDAIVKVPGEVARAFKDDSDYEVLTRHGSFHVISINSHPNYRARPELADPALRHAMSLALDRETINDSAFGGLAQLTPTVASPSSGEMFNDELTVDPHDPDSANQMLDEAGYARGGDGIRTTRDGRKLSYELLVLAGDIPTREMEAVRDNLAEIGIEIELVPLDSGSHYERIQPRGDTPGDFDLQLSIAYTEPTPVYSLSNLVCGSEGSSSASGYCERAFDAVFDESYRTADQSLRAAKLREAQAIIVEDMPLITVVQSPIVTVRSSKWAGPDPSLAESKLAWSGANEQ